MHSAPDRQGRDRHVIRRASEQLAAVLVALLFAITLPVSGIGADLTGLSVDTPTRSALTAYAVPDIAEALPFFETERELDRSRTHDQPITLADAVSIARSADGAAPADFAAPATVPPRPAGFLPFSRGPPLLA